MSKQQAWILIVVAVLAVGALVQMNRYKYMDQRSGSGSTYIIRIDRLTGQPCFVSGSERYRKGLKLPRC